MPKQKDVYMLGKISFAGLVVFLTIFIFPGHSLAQEGNVKIYGPNEYYADYPKPAKYTDIVSISGQYQGMFLRIENGNGSQIDYKKCKKKRVWHKNWKCKWTNFFAQLKLKLFKVKSAKVYWNGKKVAHFRGRYKDSGTIDVPIDAGSANQLKVKVKGMPWTRLRVTLMGMDTDPLVLTILDPQENEVLTIKEFEISGSSNRALSSITVNGEALALSADGLSFSGLFVASDNGPIALNFSGQDISGNTTAVVRNVEIDSNQPPMADFYYVFLDEFQQEMIFSYSQSYDPDGQIVKAVWDFGDGTVVESLDSEVIHYFTEPGTYNVSLSVTDDGGKISSITKEIIFDPHNKPAIGIAKVNAYSGPAPFTLEMDGSESYDPDGTIKSHQWQVFTKDDFSVNYDSELASHTFNEEGIFLVRLEVVDSNSVAIFRDLYISVGNTSAPVPVINVRRVGLKTMAFDLSDSILASGRYIESAEWRFSDGGSRWSHSSIEYDFNGFGTFLVQLTITDSAGDQGTAEITVTLNESDTIPPLVNIDYVVLSDQPPYNVYFWSERIGEGAAIVSYEWDMGDGNISSGSEFSYNFSAPGVYNVQLIVTDEDGNSGTSTATVDLTEVILPEVVLTGGPFEGEAPLTVNLDASSTTSPNGNIKSFTWDLTDDGVYNPTSYEPTVSKTFHVPGVYTLFVEVQDEAKRLKNHTFEINVKEPDNNYYLNILASQIDPRSKIVKFDAHLGKRKLESAWPVDGVSYSWTFGDGETGTGQSIEHTYQSEGPFEVVLTAEIPGSPTQTAGFTFNNLGQGQTPPVPTFLLLGNNGPAPSTIQLDARKYALAHPDIERYIWTISDSTDPAPKSSPSSFHKLTQEGSHQVTLTVVNSDGFSSTSEPQQVNVVGQRPLISVEMKATNEEIEAYYTGATMKVGQVPTLVKFSSVGSYSFSDQKLTSSWNINGETLQGPEVYYLFTEPGSYQAHLQLQDQSGNITSQTLLVDATEINCIEGLGDDLCLSFPEHLNKVLPLSSASWKISTGHSMNLLSAADQVAGQGEWAQIYDKLNNKRYDISNLLVVVGSDLILSSNDLRALGISLTSDLEFSVSVIDINNETHRGQISKVKLGLGSVELVGIPVGSKVEILNTESRFYKQHLQVAQSHLHINNLAAGNYSGTSIHNGKRSQFYFSIETEALVTTQIPLTVPQVSSASLGGASLKLSTAKFSKSAGAVEGGITIMSPAEAGAFEQQQLKTFLDQKPLSSASGDSVNSLGLVSNKTTFSKIGVSALIADDYPSWVYQTCNSDKPLEFPLASTKTDEFDVEGVSWATAAIEDTAGLYGDLTGFKKLPLNSMTLASGQRAVKFMCFVRGNNTQSFNKWKFIDGQKCCASSSDPELCRSGMQLSYKYWAIDPSIAGSTPVTFKFSVKDSADANNAIYQEEVTKSYLSIAKEMGLNNYDQIATYFGVVGTSKVANGVWAPTFSVEVPVPTHFIDPQLKLELQGYSQTFSNQKTYYGFGCYMVLNESYSPEVVAIGAREKFTKVTDSFGLDTEAIDNSRRMFEISGKFPLNWGTKDFPNNTFTFSPEFPIELKVQNSFGVTADRIKVSIYHGGVTYQTTKDVDDFVLLERDSAKQLDYYRLVLNVNDYKDSFTWDTFKTLSNGQITFSAEWDLLNGETVKSKEKKISKAVSYRMKPFTTSDLCGDGYYGAYNTFGTPNFFYNYSLIDPLHLKGRCNDISHPFGGFFGTHRGDGHTGGYGIDLRYPSKIEFGPGLDAFDQTQRAQYLDKLVVWSNKLESLYYSNGVPTNKHAELLAVCPTSGTGTPAACNTLVPATATSYTKESIHKFCHVAFSDPSFNSNYENLCDQFPATEAKILAQNIEDIRSTVEDIRFLFPRAEFYMGIGRPKLNLGGEWFRKMIEKGFLTNLHRIIKFDSLANKFLDVGFEEWDHEKWGIEYINGHETHLHMDLKD